MNETTIKKSLFNRFLIPITEKNLLKVRKYAMLLTVLVLIALVIDVYFSHFTISRQILIDTFVILGTQILATRCETLYLKMKLEKLLEEKLHD